MGSLILAHDLGTTGNKASLFDQEGHLLASAFVGYATAYPHPGWAEQDPADWWRAVCESSQRLLATSGVKASDVAVISFSGQMMSCLPLDAAGQPLRTAIIWADQRAEEEAGEIAERVGAQRIYALTGHRASAAYVAAKVLWVRRHQPELYAQARMFLQAKDYAAYRLTGVFATDYSDASGTNLFDLRGRHWSPELFAALELNPALWPPAWPSTTVIGHVTAPAAAATGLAAGTPVVIGGADGACATTGAGAVHPGEVYTYIGSSSWISFASREPLDDPQQRTNTFAHLDPQLVFPTGSQQSSGGSLDWLERLLRGEGTAKLHAQLDAQAAGVEPGARGLIFLPYLIGERSIYWNPRARGAFVGLSTAHGRAEVTRAVLEGVAMNVRLTLDAFREQGAQFAAMRLIGGGARSALWRQIVADVFNLRIVRPRLLVEATSLGAAIAGGVGVGIYPDFGVASRLVKLDPGEEPHPAAVARYEELYGISQRAYQALVPTFDQLSAYSQ